MKRGKGPDKRRLLRQVKKANDKASEARRTREAALTDQILKLKANIRSQTAIIEGMRNNQHLEEYAIARDTRDKLKAQLRELEHELNLPYSYADIDRRIDDKKAEWEAEKEKRREVFRGHVKDEMRRTRSILGASASHKESWDLSQPKPDLMARKFVPLGPSDPSMLELGWTRFDHKPEIAWKAVPGGGNFGYKDPPVRLETGGTWEPLGPEPIIPKNPYEKIETKPSWQSGTVDHPAGWRQADAVSRLFSDPKPTAPMTAYERKAAAAARKPDRTLYRPETEGKVPWKPTETGTFEFSRAQNDAEWLHAKDAVAEEKLMEKLDATAQGLEME